MALNGYWLYIDGHLDLLPVKRWPHSITDDDLKAVIGLFWTATARVFPNLNPHAHCHDAMAPFSLTGERMNVAGSLFSGLSMRCTSTPPCLLARQKKARSSVPHRGRSQLTHCNRRSVACGLAVDDAGIRTRACSCASCGTSNVLPAWGGKAFSQGECSVASRGRLPTHSLWTAVRVSMHSPEHACGSIVFSIGDCSVASLPRSVPSSPTSCICTKSACVEQRLVAAACGCSAGNASVAMEELSLCSVAAALSHSCLACVP